MAINIAALAYSLNASWPLWFLVGSARLSALELEPRQGVHGRWEAPFLEQSSLVCYSNPPVGRRPLATCWWRLCWVMPVYVSPAVCLLASAFEAHRLHLLQRLHQAGWPHSRVSFTYIAATALLAVVLLARAWPWVLGLAFAELLLGLWLDQRVAVPFSVASKS